MNDVPSIQSHHRHSGQKSSSSSHRDHQQQNRTRRTQRRVTHNEKRYHSGQRKRIFDIMFCQCFSCHIFKLLPTLHLHIFLLCVAFVFFCYHFDLSLRFADHVALGIKIV